jgi:hypothetical protein
MASTDRAAETSFSGFVDRHQGGAQVAGGQHHHRPARPRRALARGQFGQELGVAGKLEAGVVERRLGDRGGDQARHVAGQGQARAGLDPADDLGGVGAGGLAGDHRRQQGMSRTGRATAKDVQGLAGPVTVLTFTPPPAEASIGRRPPP